jgi:hypothetical protein
MDQPRPRQTDEEAVLGHAKVSMNDMIEVCRTAAWQIQSTQKALVDAALRLAPDPDEIRRMDALDACANFLDRFGPHLGAFREWLDRSRRSGRRG